jgi:hypothetical protein
MAQYMGAGGGLQRADQNVSRETILGNFDTNAMLVPESKALCFLKNSD